MSILIQMRVMQRLIIVPSILAQINQSVDPLTKQECLAMLNRLGTLVWESGGLPLIIELLDQGLVDRQLLASVLRTSGLEGEQLLIKLLKYHQSEKVRSAAASVLPYRLPEDQLQIAAVIELAATKYEIFDHTRAMKPGQMCTHRNGKICSLVLEELQNKRSGQAAVRAGIAAGDHLPQKDASTSQDEDDYLLSNRTHDSKPYPHEQLPATPTIEVHARDFLASLSRITQINDQYFRRMFENDNLSRENLI